MRLRLAPVLAAALLAVALAGCSDPSPADLSCGARVLPSDLARAPDTGGPGPVALRVKVLDVSGAATSLAAVLAWWDDGVGGVDAVGLRADGGSGIATVLAPQGATVHLAGGGSSWTNDGVVVADAASDVDLLPGRADGFIVGNWTEPVTVGLLAPARTWMPSPLPWADRDHLDRLQWLNLSLSWQNNLDGWVDLAIGLGLPHGAWTSWNQQVQTQEGSFTETLDLDRAAFLAAGLGDAVGLHAGAAAGQAGLTLDHTNYDLRYTATFRLAPDLGDLCAGGALHADDVTRAAR